MIKNGLVIPASKLIVPGAISRDNEYEVLYEEIYNYGGVIIPGIVQAGTFKVIDGWRRVEAVKDLYTAGDLISESIKIEYLDINPRQFWKVRAMLNSSRRIVTPGHKTHNTRLSHIYRIISEKSFFLDLYPDGLIPALTFSYSNGKSNGKKE